MFMYQAEIGILQTAVMFVYQAEIGILYKSAYENISVNTRFFSSQKAFSISLYNGGFLLLKSLCKTLIPPVSCLYQYAVMLPFSVSPTSWQLIRRILDAQVLIWKSNYAPTFNLTHHLHVPNIDYDL